MSVINNKGVVDEGVTYLNVVEKFPTSIAREGFSSLLTVGDPIITRVETSDVFLLDYPLVHTITYRTLANPALRTTIKRYSIVIPLRLTTPPAVGTLPTITTTVTLDDSEVFTATCGGCPDWYFNKFSRGVALEFEVATTPAA